MARLAWLAGILRMADERLRELSRSLKRKLWMLRVGVFLLVLSIVGLYAAAVAGILYPQYLPYLFAGSVVVLSLPLILLTVLAALPLRLKKMTKIIDKGYPENFKEISIRLAARKLHDESIETEELLVDTAVNEVRKAVRKYGDKPREGTEGAATGQPPAGDPPAGDPRHQQGS